MKRLSLLLAIGICGTACTSRITLPAVSPAVSTRIAIPATIQVPQGSASFVQQAGLFKILLGEAVVRYSEAYLRRAFPPGDDVLVSVEIADASEVNYQVTVALKFIVSRGDRQVFQESLTATGPGNYWNAMGDPEAALRESANVALRTIFKQFLNRASQLSHAW